MLLFVGIGVIGGFGLAAAVGVQGSGGPQVGMFIGIAFVLSGVLLRLVDRFVLSRFDTPRPTMVQEKLSQSVTLPNGRVQTHRLTPAIDPGTGRPMMARPNSSFLSIPVRFWPYVMGAGGLAIIVICAVQLLL